MEKHLEPKSLSFEYGGKEITLETGRIARQASAAVLVWAEAFESADSFHTESLRDAIAATDMKTFYGNIRFSVAGNNIAKPMVLRQIPEGKFNVVAPSKWASHPVQWPR